MVDRFVEEQALVLDPAMGSERVRLDANNKR
jgi:hypothetical protein